MIIIFWYFILGILFISIVYPLLNGILEIILSWFEAIKAKINYSITNSTIASQQLAYDFETKCAENEASNNKSFAIGFSAPNPEEEEIFEDE